MRGLSPTDSFNRDSTPSFPFPRFIVFALLGAFLNDALGLYFLLNVFVLASLTPTLRAPFRICLWFMNQKYFVQGFMYSVRQLAFSQSSRGVDRSVSAAYTRTQLAQPAKDSPPNLRHTSGPCVMQPDWTKKKRGLTRASGRCR